MTGRVETTALQQERSSSPHLAGVVQRACACGGPAGLTNSCESCNAKELAGTTVVQPKLVVGPVNDSYEQEADRVADHVMRMPDTEIAIQRLCTGCEEEEKSIQGKRDGGPTGEVSAKQTSEIESIKSGGEPLRPASRDFFEQRFGHDFSSVRIHSDDRAAQSAQGLHALAYTTGQHIVFGAGHYSPDTHAGQKLLAHELTHVIQQGSSAARLMRAPADPAEKAHYPTQQEQEQVKPIFNPQQSAAEESGNTTVDPVTEPGKFRTEMKDCMDDYIGKVLPGAQARQSSSTSLDLPQVQSMADVVQKEVEKFFKPYLTAAVRSPDEKKRLEDFKLRDTTHMVSSKHPDATLIACNWLSSRMADACGKKIGDFNVMASTNKAKDSCFPATPSSTPSTAPTTTPPGERDQTLFQSVRDDILSARKSDLETIVKFQSSFEAFGESFIQDKIKPESGDTGNMTMRRGRWQAFGTIIHEMLHAIAHEKFNEAISGVERQGIGVEGFAEYFARIVYNDVRARAATDDALRTSIEGVNEPFNIDLAPDRSGGTYDKYVEAVEQIKTEIAGNEESLRVAYFMGKVEYIGLGGWNAADAERHEALRHPANTLGFGAVLTGDTRGLLTVNYARFVYGRGKPFQIGLGPQIYYLTPGEHKEADVTVPEGGRLGVGGRAMLQYSWPNFYIRGSLGAGASVTFDKPFEHSVRLDLIPGAEAGVRIGWARVGAGTQVLIPVYGGPIGEKTTKAGGFLGVSAEW